MRLINTVQFLIIELIRSLVSKYQRYQAAYKEYSKNTVKLYDKCGLKIKK